MSEQEWKQQILAHCLWMASLDPDYAISAAGWYESMRPDLLKNLQAKVRQEIARGHTSTARVESGTAMDRPA